MSTQGGGAATGLVVGCLGLGLYLAGKATVLAAKGLMLVGKGLHEAYREHERRVAERLKKQEAGIARLQALDRALTETEHKLRDGNSRLAGLPTNESVECERRLARALSRRKQSIAQEKATAERLDYELQATLAKLQTVQDQRPGRSSSSQSAIDSAHKVEEKEESLREQAADLDQRIAKYSSLRERVDQEIRAELLADADTLIPALEENDTLRSRLEVLKAAGTLEESEEFLRQVYRARSNLSAGQDANQQQRLVVSKRLLAARLMAENLRCLAQAEREELLGTLTIADEKLDKDQTAQADSRLQAIELKLDSYRKRDIRAWVCEEQKAKDALRAALSLSLAMEEDEGMRELLSAQGKETEFKSCQDSLENARALYQAGRFEVAAGIASDQAEKLGRLRDEVLSTENRARIKALAELARQAMEGRGFTDVQVTLKGTDWCVQGQRGATSFWVNVHEEGTFEFDLGKEGFSSQTECWAEIDAFLEALRSKGVHLDIRFTDPTLDPNEAYDPNRLPDRVTEGGSVPTRSAESKRLKEGQ